MNKPLDQIDTWVFDLDNTLYPASSRLFDQISRKMTSFIMETLHVDREEAYKIQKTYFQEYGTTMRGLMVNHDTDPLQFLDYVHDIDLSPIKNNNNALNRALSLLPGRKIIFTNGSKNHANNIINHMGVNHHFDAIFDIVDSGFIPKPDRKAYQILVQELTINPKTTIMVEDMACNLLPASDLGMTTVWVKSDLEWATKSSGNGHIDYIIGDLTNWLEHF